MAGFDLSRKSACITSGMLNIVLFVYLCIKPSCDSTTSRIRKFELARDSPRFVESVTSAPSATWRQGKAKEGASRAGHKKQVSASSLDDQIPSLFPPGASLQRCTSTPSRFAIVGLADSYGVRDLALAVKTIRRVMPASEVDIVFFNNKNDTGLMRLASDEHVTFLKFSYPPTRFKEQYPIASDFGVYRFFHYRAIVATGCYRGYLFIDTRDVIFQRNIFAITPSEWWSDGVVASYEGRRSLNTDGVVTNPNGNILAAKKHMDMFKCMWSPSDERYRSMNFSITMACTGVLGGGGASLNDMLDTYALEMLRLGSRKCQRWIPDQILFNMLLGTGRMPKKLFVSLNEDGPIYHQRKQLVEKYHEEPFTVMNEDRKSIPAVLHHIDRTPSLVKFGSDITRKLMES